jgi:hypothetical protein
MISESEYKEGEKTLSSDLTLVKDRNAININLITLSCFGIKRKKNVNNYYIDTRYVKTNY